MSSRTIPQPVSIIASLQSIDLALLQTLFDQATDMAFFVKDNKGRYLIVNDSLLHRHALRQKSDAVGKRPCDICPGDMGRVSTEQDERVLRTSKPLINHLELHWLRPRESVWCLTTKLPICDADGKVVGLVGFSRDVRAPVEADEIPAGFAVALKEFEQHLAADFSAAVLARRSRLSPQRLARLTRRLFDLTPTQLISKTRIMAASRLLHETRKSVAQIAHESGYYDQSAFTRAFRSTTGMAPLEYRRNRS